MSSNRRFRLADQLQSDIAALIRTASNTNQVLQAAGVVSVLEVQLNRDASHAQVYFSVLYPQHAEAVALECNRMAPQWRSSISRLAHIYKVPALQFRYDDTQIGAGRINYLLRQIAEEKTAQNVVQDFVIRDS